MTRRNQIECFKYCKLPLSSVYRSILGCCIPWYWRGEFYVVCVILFNDHHLFGFIANAAKSWRGWLMSSIIHFDLASLNSSSRDWEWETCIQSQHFFEVEAPLVNSFRRSCWVGIWHCCSVALGPLILFFGPIEAASWQKDLQMARQQAGDLLSVDAVEVFSLEISFVWMC